MPPLRWAGLWPGLAAFGAKREVPRFLKDGRANFLFPELFAPLGFLVYILSKKKLAFLQPLAIMINKTAAGMSRQF